MHGGFFLIMKINLKKISLLFLPTAFTETQSLSQGFKFMKINHFHLKYFDKFRPSY